MYKLIDVLNEVKETVDEVVSTGGYHADVEINMQPMLAIGDVKKTVIFISGGGFDEQQINRVQCDELLSVFVRLIVPLKNTAREKTVADCCNAVDFARRIARTLAKKKTLGGSRLNPSGKIIVYSTDDDPILGNSDKKQCYGQVIRIDLLDRYSAVSDGCSV